MGEQKRHIIFSGIDHNGLKLLVYQCISQYGIPINRVGCNIKDGYVGKSKVALQISFKHGFFDATFKDT